MSGYDGNGYAIAPVRDGKTMGLPLVAPRVTDIVKPFGDIPPNALGYSGMRIGADAISKLVEEGYPFDIADADAIYAAMKDTGITPPVVWGAKRDLGSVAHDSIEYFLRHGDWPHVADDARGYVDAGKAWINRLCGAEILGVEETLWNPSPFFAGTPDLIYRDGDEYVIADYKTSKMVGLDYLLQIAFYGVAAMTHGICPTWPTLIVVQLLPNGKYKEHRSSLGPPHVMNAYRAWEAKEQAKRECAA